MTGLDCHNTKVKMLCFFLDARGRIELSENNNLSQTSSSRCKRNYGGFFYLENTPMYFF